MNLIRLLFSRSGGETPSATAPLPSADHRIWRRFAFGLLGGFAAIGVVITAMMLLHHYRYHVWAQRANLEDTLWSQRRLALAVAGRCADLRGSDGPELPAAAQIERAIALVARGDSTTSAAIKTQLEEFTAAVQRSAAATDYDRALVEFLEHRFHLAAVQARLAADAAAADLRGARAAKDAEADDRADEARERKRDAHMLAGFALCVGDEVEDALTEFVAAQDDHAPEIDDERWNSLQNRIGQLHWGLAARIPTRAGRDHLDAAIAAYRNALELSKRSLVPPDCMGTQRNLGLALLDRAERTPASDSAPFIGDAVAALRAALAASDPLHTPEQWVAARRGLAAALEQQTERDDPFDAAVYHRRTVALARDALAVLDRERSPGEWAMLQTCLGEALVSQAALSQSPKARALLIDAVAAHRRALTVATPERLPQLWTASQIDLGTALTRLAVAGESAAAAPLFSEAAAACRSTFAVITREQLPVDWAKAQAALALILRTHAERSTSPEATVLLEEASTACRRALTVFTAGEFPSLHAAILTESATIQLRNGS